MDLSTIVDAWGRQDFASVLDRCLAGLDADVLPLQQGLRHGSLALTDDVRIVVSGFSADATHIRVRACLFYRSVIAGCACADDPSPPDTLEEACHVRFDIDRTTGEGRVTITE